MVINIITQIIRVSFNMLFVKIILVKTIILIIVITSITTQTPCVPPRTGDRRRGKG